MNEYQTVIMRMIVRTKSELRSAQDLLHEDTERGRAIWIKYWTEHIEQLEREQAILFQLYAWVSQMDFSTLDQDV